MDGWMSTKRQGHLLPRDPTDRTVPTPAGVPSIPMDRTAPAGRAPYMHALGLPGKGGGECQHCTGVDRTRAHVRPPGRSTGGYSRAPGQARSFHADAFTANQVVLPRARAAPLAVDRATQTAP